jgi:hypothetical protein
VELQAGVVARHLTWERGAFKNTATQQTSFSYECCRQLYI